MNEKRLKEIEDRFYKTGYKINTASPEPQQIHADLQYLIYTVKEQAEQVDSMAHVIKVKNKEMRELSNFLKERNIPLKELSPLITVMNHVQELEKAISGAKVICNIATEEKKKSEKQNNRYREGLEKIAHVENGFHPLAIEARITIEEVDRLALEESI